MSVMAICIKCGKENNSCLCDACRATADIEALCEEIMEYQLGSGENALWDKIASDFYSPYNFKYIGFAIAEYLPFPRKEYRKILSLSGNTCNVSKSSRPWLYEVYDLCKDAEGLSEMEQNRIRGLVVDALYKDYDFEKADELASKSLESEDLPKQVYITLADFYTITRRYGETDKILREALTAFPNDSYVEKNVKEFSDKNEKRREAAKKGKREYVPQPEEAKQKYADFLASRGINAEINVRTVSVPEAIPKDQYPKPVETRDANFNSFVAFDLETTGTIARFDNIIEFGAIKVVDGKIVDSQEFIFQELVMPHERRIPEEVQKLTGITPDDVKDARLMWEVTPDFMKFVDDNILVGFNCIAFDSKLLVRAGRYSHIIIKNKYFDVMRYAKLFKDQLGLEGQKCSLGILAEKLNIKNPRAHRALSDAITTAQVYLKLKAMDGNARIDSVDDLISDIESW